MTARHTIAVCATRRLFGSRDAEDRAHSLVDAFRSHGHIADVVSLPSMHLEDESTGTEALRWGLLDLGGDAMGRRIDVVVCTHPLALLARHPVKVAWLSDRFEEIPDRLLATALARARGIVVSGTAPARAVVARVGTAIPLTVLGEPASAEDVLRAVCLALPGGTVA